MVERDNVKIIYYIILGILVFFIIGFGCFFLTRFSNSNKENNLDEKNEQVNTVILESSVVNNGVLVHLSNKENRKCDVVVTIKYYDENGNLNDTNVSNTSILNKEESYLFFENDTLEKYKVSYEVKYLDNNYEDNYEKVQIRFFEDENNDIIVKAKNIDKKEILSLNGTIVFYDENDKEVYSANVKYKNILDLYEESFLVKIYNLKYTYFKLYINSIVKM